MRPRCGRAADRSNQPSDLDKRREVVTQLQQSIPDSGQIHSTTDSAQRSDLGVFNFVHTPRGQRGRGMRGLLRELRRQAAILVFGGYPSAVRAVSGPDSS